MTVLVFGATGSADSLRAQLVDNVGIRDLADRARAMGRVVSDGAAERR